MDNEFLENISIPLADEYVEVLFNELDWSDILWGNDMIKVKDLVI